MYVYIYIHIRMYVNTYVHSYVHTHVNIAKLVVISNTYLNSVRVAGLAQDFQEAGVRNKEEPWEDQPLLLQVPSEGLLTELQLLQEVGQELAQRLIPHTALHHIRHFVGTSHNLLPRLVDVTEPFGFLQRTRVCVCACVRVCVCVCVHRRPVQVLCKLWTTWNKLHRPQWYTLGTH